MLTTSIMIPDMPNVQGLRFRPIFGEEDTDALYAVHTGRITRDGVDISSHHEDFPTREGMRADLAHAAAAGEQDQWLVVQVDERVVGYSQLASWPEEDGTWVYFIGGWVLPEWRGQGIGSAMLHWGEALSRQLAAMEHPHERFEFAANASGTEQDAAALLHHEGYFVGFTTLVLRYDISTTLPPKPLLPEGFELRPVLPEHYPQIIHSIIESYLHEFPGNRFRSKYDRVAYFTAELQKPRYDPKLWYVAWDGDDVAGQVFLVIENGEVEVSQVSIRPAWRRRGLGRALLVRALQDMRARGEDKIWLDTYAEYPTRAVDLYRSLGFYVSKVFPRYRKTAM
jgi:ribosomal protein S18 acetylase RimI-like enzyme